MYIHISPETFSHFNGYMWIYIRIFRSFQFIFPQVTPRSLVVIKIYRQYPPLYDTLETQRLLVFFPYLCEPSHSGVKSVGLPISVGLLLLVRTAGIEISVTVVGVSSVVTSSQVLEGTLVDDHTKKKNSTSNLDHNNTFQGVTTIPDSSDLSPFGTRIYVFTCQYHLLESSNQYASTAIFQDITSYCIEKTCPKSISKEKPNQGVSLSRVNLDIVLFACICKCWNQIVDHPLLFFALSLFSFFFFSPRLSRRIRTNSWMKILAKTKRIFAWRWWVCEHVQPSVDLFCSFVHYYSGSSGIWIIQGGEGGGVPMEQKVPMLNLEAFVLVWRMKYSGPLYCI